MDYNPVPKPKYKRFKPKKVDRGKFSKKVRDEIKEHFNNQCQECGGKAHHVHHVHLRSQGGRGTFTNGLLVCNNCHRYIHDNPSRIKYWQNKHRVLYGKSYFKDKEDLEREASDLIETMDNY